MPQAFGGLPIFSLAEPLYYYRHRPDSASYARRLEQIEWSAEVIRRALRRRGLADRLTLDVELVGRFRLVPASSRPATLRSLNKTDQLPVAP